MNDALLTDELQKVLAAASAAWAGGDAEAFASLYTDDATAILPGFRLADATAIRTSMAAAFQGQLRGTRRTHVLLEVRPLGADAAIATTTSATLAPNEQEVPEARQEWATWVFVRLPGDAWRIKAYHGCPTTA